MEIKRKEYGLFDILTVTFSCSALNSIMIMVLCILDGLMPVWLINATASLIDKISLVVSQGKAIDIVVVPAIILGAIIAYPWLSDKLIAFPMNKLKLKIKEKYRTAVVEKTAKLKFRYIENKETWDLITRVTKEPEKRFAESLKESVQLISLFITIFLIFFKIFIYVWWAPIAIIGTLAFMMWLCMKGGKQSYEAEREVSKYERKYNYLSQVMKDREAVEERTLFQYGDYVNEKFEESYNDSVKILFKVRGKWFVRMKSTGVVMAIIVALTACILTVPVLNSTMTIGMFMGIMNSIIELVQKVSWTVAYLMEQFVKNKEYMKDITKFAMLEESKDALLMPCNTKENIHSLEFKNVSFKYPGTEKYVLKNLSFTMKEGKHYALVGTNGCGKTTITKLISGLYDEYEGEIFINGKDMRTYCQNQLKSMYSMVYQDFARYFVSFKDNIALGDVTNIGNEMQEQSIQSVIDTMNLKEAVEELPQGMDTYLGKIKEGGQDLSGGQWQRVAMARCILGSKDFKILDEPTAALDPVNESRIYEEFEKISKGSTTIFISHRLGSTRLADEIFVLDEGNIKEKGSFEELLNLEGLYTEMYESQRSWYVNE